MKKVVGKLMMLCVLALSVNGFAQSTPDSNQDSMKHDDMKQDTMKHDDMAKDDMAKDKKAKKLKKKKMKKDDMKKKRRHEQGRDEAELVARSRPGRRILVARCGCDGVIAGYLPRFPRSAQARALARQVSPQAPNTRHISFTNRFGSSHHAHPASALVLMYKPAARGMKGLAFARNLHHHLGRNAGPRVSMIRTQGRGCGRIKPGQGEAAGNQGQRGHGNEPSESRSPGTGHGLGQLFLPAGAKTRRQFNQAVIGVQVNHVSGAIEHRGAMPALANMLLHRDPQFRADLVLKVI